MIHHPCFVSDELNGDNEGKYVYDCEGGRGGGGGDSS